MKSSHDHSHEDAERWKHDGVPRHPRANQLDPNVPLGPPAWTARRRINFARARRAEIVGRQPSTIKPDAKTGAHHHGPP